MQELARIHADVVDQNADPIAFGSGERYLGRHGTSLHGNAPMSWLNSHPGA